MELFDLTGKVAVVTGGGSGLGELAAKALANAGAALVLSGRNLEALQKVASEIEAGGGKASAVRADVTRRDEVERMTQEALQAFGKIDILVNNAGINIVKPFLKLTEGEWDVVINTNLKGVFHCCQAIGKGMVERKSGSVINIVSVFGLTGFMNLAPYISSKGAVVQLTKALAVEWARHNVRVNAIAPSYMKAGMAKRDIESDEKILQFNINKIPMRREGMSQTGDQDAIRLGHEGG